MSERPIDPNNVDDAAVPLDPALGPWFATDWAYWSRKQVTVAPHRQGHRLSMEDLGL